MNSSPLAAEHPSEDMWQHWQGAGSGNSLYLQPEDRQTGIHAMAEYTKPGEAEEQEDLEDNQQRTGVSSLRTDRGYKYLTEVTSWPAHMTPEVSSQSALHRKTDISGQSALHRKTEVSGQSALHRKT